MPRQMYKCWYLPRSKLCAAMALVHQPQGNTHAHTVTQIINDDVRFGSFFPWFAKITLLG